MTSLFHLLKGKKTSSILVYGYFYQLLPYFGLFKDLDKEIFLKEIQQLAEKKQLLLQEDWLIYSGKYDDIQDVKEDYPFLNGFLYPNAEDNWGMILFSLQVVSEKIHHERDYLPLLDSYFKQQLIKRWLKVFQLDKKEQQEKLYQEFFTILEKLPEKTAQRLSEQFFGYQRIGQVPQQLYLKAYPFNYLDYLDDLGAFLAEVKAQNGFLQALFPSTKTSVDETASYVFQGANFSQLMVRRPELKASTLRDHIIEIAVRNPQKFPYSHYISPNTFEIADEIKEQDYRLWSYPIFKEKNIDFLSYRLMQILRQEGLEDEFRS